MVHNTLSPPQACGRTYWRLSASWLSLLTGWSLGCPQTSSHDWCIVSSMARVSTAPQQILSKKEHSTEHFIQSPVQKNGNTCFCFSCMAGYINNTLSIARVDGAQMVAPGGLNVTQCRFVSHLSVFAGVLSTVDFNLLCVLILKKIDD